MEKRIKYLENKTSKDVEDKHWNNFEKQSQYMGNGIYKWMHLYSKDTRELFLMGVLFLENVAFKID